MSLLSFGSYHWKVQLLGTEASESKTWLWAWANIDSNFPAALLQASKALKEYGEKHDIPELIESQIPLDEINGHILSMIATGICQANAYYRAPYEGGAAYLLIIDDNFPRCLEPHLSRIVHVFPQAISSLEIHDHKLAFVSYLVPPKRYSSNIGYQNCCLLPTSLRLLPIRAKESCLIISG